MKQKIPFFILLSIVTLAHSMQNEEITQNGITQYISNNSENYRDLIHGFSATYYPLRNIQYEAAINVKTDAHTTQSVEVDAKGSKIIFDGMKAQFDSFNDKETETETP